MTFDRHKAQNKAKRSRISLFQFLLTEKLTTTTCTSYCSNDAEFWFLPKKRQADKFCATGASQRWRKCTSTEQWEIHGFSNLTNCSLDISRSKHLRDNLFFPRLDLYLIRVIEKSHVQLGYVSGSLGFAFLLPLFRPSSAFNFPASSLSVGVRLIRVSPRRKDIEFELATLKNLCWRVLYLKTECCNPVGWKPRGV